MTLDEEITKYEPFSNKRMIAFAIHGALLSMVWTLRNWIQVYAALALGIPILYILLVFGIYVIWDAVNDPLTGNLLDRSSKFTSKHGKRFPFIVIGIMGALLCLTMLYIPVSFDPLLAVLWILMIIIIYDAFQTLYELSIRGLTVDMFRDEKQRVKLSSITHIVTGASMIFIGVFIPVLLGIFGGAKDANAYFYMTLVVISVMLIMAIPNIWSAREPEEMRELRTRLNVEGKSSSPPKEVLVRGLKDRNWMGVIIGYVIWVVEIGCISVGITFYVLDGLGLPIAAVGLPILLFLLVSFAVVPIWMKIAKKLGLKRTFFYSLLTTAITTAIFIFASNYNLLLILAAIGGIGHGGQGVAFDAITSEAIDNATLKSGIREESSYHGILRFFTATAIFWQVLIFAIVGTITGYDPALGTNNSEFAKLGLLLQMSIVPAIIMLIGSLIFWKLYTVTKDQAIENKNKLIEMNL